MNKITLIDDSIPMVVNGVISEQYEQSLRLDTLSSRVDSIMEITEQFGQSTQLDTILSRIDTIMEYGVGYHDAAEHIAMPLLIALFAFSFTFLFPAINHINNKYNSPRLSFIFSHSFPYVFYWICTILDVTTLIAYGLSSLFSSDTFHHWVMRQTWVLLFVAGVYSFAIIRFVLYCIQFNKPSWLLQKVDIKDEIMKKSDIAAWEIFKLNDRIDLETSVNIIDQNILGYLPDLFRYAITNSNMQLFDSIMGHITQIAETENKTAYATYNQYGRPQYPLYAYYSTLLLDSLFGIYAPMPTNVHVESLLIRNKLNCHSHRYAVEKLSLAPILKMAEYGHKSMMDTYVEMSSNSYSFINSLPSQKYVQGETEEEIKKTEKECFLSWNYVRCAHFFLAAYWFAKEQYSFMNTLISAKDYSMIRQPLYPLSDAGIISCYMNCNSHIDMGGGQYIDMVDGVKITVTRPMLERYTAALLMFVFDKKQYDEPLSEYDVFEVFNKDYKKSILKYCEELKDDEKFISQFPSVKNIDIKVFNNSFNPCYLPYTIDPEVQSIQSYLANNDILELITKNAKELWSANGIGPNLTDVNLGKLRVFKPKDYQIGISYHITKLTKARAYYIMLSAYNNMKIHVIKTNRKGFDKCLKRITKNKVDKYILIDLDSQVGMYYSKIKNRYVYEETYNWPEEVKDSLLYDRIGKSMLVVEKKDRPIITTDGKLPELTIEDNSLLDENNPYYHIIFNSHLVVKYNKDAVIYSIVEK